MWRGRKNPEDTSCTWLWRWSIRNRVYSKKEQSDPTLSIRRWWWWWTRCMRLGQCEFSSPHFSEREINSRFQLEVEIFKHIENIGCQIKSSVPTGTPLLQLLSNGTLKTSQTKQAITIALNRPPGLDFNTYFWRTNQVGIDEEPSTLLAGIHSTGRLQRKKSHQHFYPVWNIMSGNNDQPAHMLMGVPVLMGHPVTF